MTKPAWLLGITLVLFLPLGCTPETQKRPGAEVETTIDKQVAVYLWNAEKGKCLDSEGKPGLNKGGKLGECSEIIDQDFSNQDLKGMSMRGSKIVNTSFKGADLSDADLNDTELVKVDFTKARLYGADIVPKSKDEKAKDLIFKDCEIDGDTKLPVDVDSDKLKDAVFKDQERDWAKFIKTDLKLDMHLHPNLSARGNAIVGGDLKRLSEIQLDEEKAAKDNLYAKVFLADSKSEIEHPALRFLSERIHYISKLTKVKNPTPWDDIIVAENNAILALQGLITGKPVLLEWLKEDGSKEEIELKSPRAGWVQLRRGYFAAQKRRLERGFSLIHEARHSDCPEMPNETDRQLFLSGSDKEILKVENKTCVNVHVVCPSGHNYENIPACEDYAWGSYAIEAIYADAVYQYCDDCTEREQQLALMVSKDRFSRLLPSKEILEKEMQSTEPVLEGL